jgi:ABC-type branched-subunit amino acid transport system substrate-binding protein
MAAETGPNASPLRHNAIELAIDEANKNGGADGHPIKYQAYDAGIGTDPTQTVTAVQKAISDHVDAIMGIGATAALKAVAPIVAQAGIPMIHTAQNPTLDLSKLGAQGNGIFRAWPRSDLDAEVMADYISDVVKPTKLGLLNTTDETSAFVGKAIVAALNKKGFTNIVHREVSPTATDLTEAIVAFKGTDVTVQWGFPAVDVLFQKQMTANGENQPTVCSPSCATMFTQNLNSPNELTNITYLSHCDPDVLTTKEARDFVTSYRAKFPDQAQKDTASAQPSTYDEVLILAKAATDAKSIDAKAVIAQLGKMTYTGVCGPYKTDNEHNMVHSAQLVDERGGPLQKKLVKSFGGLSGVDVEP